MSTSLTVNDVKEIIVGERQDFAEMSDCGEFSTRDIVIHTEEGNVRVTVYGKYEDLPIKVAGEDAWSSESSDATLTNLGDIQRAVGRRWLSLSPSTKKRLCEKILEWMEDV